MNQLKTNFMTIFTPKKTLTLPQAILLLSLIAIIFWTLLRIGLWLTTEQEIEISEFAKVLSLGLWFDFGTLAYLLAPILFASAVMPNPVFKSKIGKRICWSFVWIVFAALLFDMVAEVIFWQEFTTRFNFIAVDYLIYTHEVLGNIQESYPVTWILAGIALVTSLGILFLRHRYTFMPPSYNWRKRVALAFSAFLLPLLSFYLVNLDQAQVKGNVIASEIASNGLFSLAAAMRRNDLDYERFYQTIPQAEADHILASLGVARFPLSHLVNEKDKSLYQHRGEHNAIEMGPFTRQPKNIVLITVESLSAEYLGVYGGKGGLTPELDKIASKSLMFDRLYATGTRTVRGLEALSLGTPPVPGQAIVHRPNNEHLATIGEFLEAQGFYSSFIYGGYGYFDNMNAYFRSNDYHVIDRTDFKKNNIASENIWGVADESLFDHALTTLDKNATEGKHFFSHLMTTSNHRPYTFPEGRIDQPQGHRPAAIKYTDYAIGRFLKQAETKPWFKDTLFVIVADHCASVAGKSKLPVAKYHIPMFFYAPDMLKPGHYSRMASQIDLAPTLLDLLGAKGEEHFFGQSLFKSENLPARAFISNYQELGYYKDDTLIVLSPKHKTEAFRISPDTFEAKPTVMNERLKQEAIAYYQTASVGYKKAALKEHADDHI